MAAETVNQTGIRAVLAQGVIDFPAPGVSDPSRNIEVATRFIEKWTAKNPLIRPSIFCHSPYTCSAETLQKAKTVANRHQCLFQMVDEGDRCLEFSAVAVINNRRIPQWRLAGFRMQLSRLIFSAKWTRNPLDLFLNNLRCNEMLMDQPVM